MTKNASDQPFLDLGKALRGGWKWEQMELPDRVFLCQNKRCAYHLFPQDRDYNAALNILYEALRLIGLVDQAVTANGSDEDVNQACGRGVRPQRPSPPGTYG